MFKIIYDAVRIPIERRIDELVEDDPSVDAKEAFDTILYAVESGAITLDQLPDLTLRTPSIDTVDEVEG